MTTILNSFSNSGIHSIIIKIEIDIVNALPSISFSGMGDIAIRESKDRIYSAIKNSNFNFPRKKIIINLAPSDLRKKGTTFDLGIAIGILINSNQINLHPNININNFAFIGELSLGGNTREFTNILPMLLEAKTREINFIFIPKDNLKEALIIDGINIIPVKNLCEVVYFLENFDTDMIKRSNINLSYVIPNHTIDFKDILDQDDIIEHIIIAIAGEHNILLIGSPGCGKSMIAKRIITILPPMSKKESLEVTILHSSYSKNNKGTLIKNRPFRAPHHNISIPSLIGGGKNAKPGEISLAHNGVLFLDELTQFSKQSLDALRQPLEDGYVTISRIEEVNNYPCNFILVASMNPCPCGYYGEDKCKCTDYEIIKYRKKISGPIMDRIDIQKYVKPVNFLNAKASKYNSKSILNKIIEIKKIQSERFKNDEISSNSKMSEYHLKKYCTLDEKCNNFIKSNFQNLNFSARSYNKYLKIARTRADFNNHKNIQINDLKFAFQSRDLDKEENQMLIVK